MKSSISNINIADRGDFISIDDKNQEIKKTYFPLNFASGEPESYLSKSSATFIVPSEIIIEQNSNNNHHHFYIWFEENLISLTMSTGLIIIFIIIPLTLIIY